MGMKKDPGPSSIDNPYAFSDISAVYSHIIGDLMEKKSEWASYLDEICYPVERYLIGFAVRDKVRLVSAIISNAFLKRED